jgi:AAA family ATP:ADP antiporter
MICLLLLVLNLVNTTGEYILSRSALERANEFAAADPKFNKATYIGAFYGSYFF